jgi:LysM domain.
MYNTASEYANSITKDDFFDGATRYHIVQQNENLYRLSQEYNTTVKQLMLWNNKETPELQIGEILRVSE